MLTKKSVLDEFKRNVLENNCEIDLTFSKIKILQEVFSLSVSGILRTFTELLVYNSKILLFL